MGEQGDIQGKEETDAENQVTYFSNMFCMPCTPWLCFMILEHSQYTQALGSSLNLQLGTNTPTPPHPNPLTFLVMGLLNLSISKLMMMISWFVLKAFNAQ